jgi:hypothetical protein
MPLEMLWLTNALGENARLTSVVIAMIYPGIW